MVLGEVVLRSNFSQGRLAESVEDPEQAANGMRARATSVEEGRVSCAAKSAHSGEQQFALLDDTAV